MSRFVEIQQAFTAHIKDPEANTFEYGIEDRRLKIYRDLFFNNVLGFLDTGFPVLKSLYQEEEWLELARTFFAQHHCRSPYFVDISKEFVEFLANEYKVQENDPPFLQELAHYEWVELDVSVRKGDVVVSKIEQILASSTVRFSDVASLVSYQFPVHEIGPDYQPEESTGQVFIIVYRDAEDDVEFTLVNEVTAFLVNLIENNPGILVTQLVAELTAALPQMSEEQLSSATVDILQQFMQKQIFVIE
jgi:hypothetical protein